MEFSLRTLVIMIIIVVAMFVFISMILGWGNDANTWFKDTFGGMKSILGGE